LRALRVLLAVEVAAEVSDQFAGRARRMLPKAAAL
jgi:hypothetical protein